MMPDDSPFEAAVKELCTGSEEAIWDFIQMYGPHIQRVVRRRLHHKLRSKFDSVDFVQMVWVSFFAEPDRLAQFEKPEDVIRYLVVMAKNKVVEESRRRFEYEKHNVSRERPLEQAEIQETERRSDTPSQIAIARERWQTMIQGEPERNRQILQMRLNGATFLEISESLGIHERTARQVMQKLATANSD